jgi:DNA-binding MarR family transcriptional regulator
MFENIMKLNGVNGIKEIMHRCGNGLPGSEFFMLKVIKHFADSQNSPNEYAGVKMSNLSEYLEITKSAVSQVMNSLEQKRLIERTMADSDRRVIYVKLTDEGEKVLKRMREMCWRGLTEVLDRLGDEDALELNRILIKLNGILRELKDENLWENH